MFIFLPVSISPIRTYSNVSTLFSHSSLYLFISISSYNIQKEEIFGKLMQKKMIWLLYYCNMWKEIANYEVTWPKIKLKVMAIQLPHVIPQRLEVGMILNHDFIILIVFMIAIFMVFMIFILSHSNTHTNTHANTLTHSHTHTNTRTLSLSLQLTGLSHPVLPRV